MIIIGIAGGTGSGKTTVVKKEPARRFRCRYSTRFLLQRPIFPPFGKAQAD